jgi:hypothetical protein
MSTKEWTSDDVLKKNSAAQAVESIDEKERSISDASSQEFVDPKLLKQAEDVAIQVLSSSALLYETVLIRLLKVISTRDDPDLPILTFRVLVLGVGLSVFSSVRR